ncbi:hypothetical protein BJY18_000369 [Amycolatopsis jiangsuensis]|uniref:Uncharacterized protein n=1 Tax=Amycolatopsis jiangsuensis TaxID=1181879 RepID=A0A840IP94_9PSEU|nr:hypothetical protein [Amycolatopsis jiangsuensis]
MRTTEITGRAAVPGSSVLLPGTGGRGRGGGPAAST